MGLQSALSTAVSSLSTNVRRATVAADNIANATTPGFVPNKVIVTSVGAQGYAGGGVRAVVRPAIEAITVAQDVSNVDLGQEFVTLIRAQTAYGNSAEVIRTASDMMRTLLDEEI